MNASHVGRSGMERRKYESFLLEEGRRLRTDRRKTAKAQDEMSDSLWTLFKVGLKKIVDVLPRI